MTKIQCRLLKYPISKYL